MQGSSVEGYIHSIETFGLVDGPGVRFVVFLQGCPMRCQYCHNPETWKMKEGELWTAETLFARACRYHRYWKGKRGGEVTGGITVSGGEPLLQMEFVTRFFRLAKERGAHTALDTSGALFSMKDPFWGRFCSLMEVTDLVILDLKEMDSERHRILTGHGNENSLQMAKTLSDMGKDMWIRHVLVPGVTDSRESLLALRDFLGTLETVRRAEILPYHTMGQIKWEQMGLPYALDGVRPPSEEEVRRAEELTGMRA